MTVVAGEQAATASPITPYPQPRSSTRPLAGGSVSRNSTAVPMSSRPRAKTPEPLVSESRLPQTVGDHRLAGERDGRVSGEVVVLAHPAILPCSLGREHRHMGISS